MDQTTLPRAEVMRLAYKEAEEVSRELITKSRHFAQEVIAKGGITGLGHFSKYVKKQSSAAWAFLGGKDSDDIVGTIMLTAAFDDLSRKVGESIASANIALLGTVVPPSLPHQCSVLDGSDLSFQFMETVGVSEEVHETLMREVEDFQFVQESIKNAEDPTFVGPMLTAEFEKYRRGEVYGPLTCQFEAHAALQEKGIEFVPEHDTFIFPQDMVDRTCRTLDDKTSQQDATHFVLVFKEHAHPHKQDLTPRSEWKTMIPDKVLVPRGEALTPAYA